MGKKPKVTYGKAKTMTTPATPNRPSSMSGSTSKKGSIHPTKNHGAR